MSVKYLKDHQTKENIYPIIKSECIIDAFSISTQEIDALLRTVDGIATSINDTVLSVGDSIPVTYEVLPEGPVDQSDFVWTSSNERVATISNGVITAVAEGECTVSINSNYYEVSASIHILVDNDVIDLGLPSGLKWAKCNLGAKSPEQYGDYYSWGETSVKDSYESSDYTLYDSDGNMIKYNESDSLTTLLPEDDAATVNLGGQWRMPTRDEFIELIEECSVQDHTINDIPGLLFTGPNGNSIFLPHTGYWSPENAPDEVFDSGYYWTSSIEDGSAVAMSTGTGSIEPYEDYGYYGQSVRPVTK